MSEFPHISNSTQLSQNKWTISHHFYFDKEHITEILQDQYSYIILTQHPKFSLENRENESNGLWQ